MSWCEQLTHRPALPKWRGPVQVYLKLSDGDEPEEGETAPAPIKAEKFCPACERALPATKEHFYSHTVRGKPYLHTKCKDCMRAEQAERDSRLSGGRK